jgi:hypothetical protein
VTGIAEEPLVGGRIAGPVRVGDTVRRPVQPWTATVHAVLRYLEEAGFAGAPRVLGFDERGREVLTYLDGETLGAGACPWPEWVFSDGALAQVGAWLRRLHDVTAGFTPPPDARWFAGHAWKPGLVIGHHDAAPFNAVWRDRTLIGFVDWDTAGPSSRELDLAYVALTWVPLHARRVVAEYGFTAFDDRARRLRLLLDAYGYDGDRSAFGGHVAHRARVNAAAIRRMAAAGGSAYTALLPVAADYEEAAAEVETLPPEFWEPPVSAGPAR